MWTFKLCTKVFTKCANFISNWIWTWFKLNLNLTNARYCGLPNKDISIYQQCVHAIIQSAWFWQFIKSLELNSVVFIWKIRVFGNLEICDYFKQSIRTKLQTRVAFLLFCNKDCNSKMLSAFKISPDTMSTSKRRQLKRQKLQKNNAADVHLAFDGGMFSHHIFNPWFSCKFEWCN